VKEDFRIGFPSDPGTQELGDTRHEAFAHEIELRDRPGLREEPLAIPEWVRVLRSKRPDRRGPNVTDDDVRPYVPGQLREIDVRAIVDGSTPHEDLAPLVKADSPAERSPFCSRTQRLGLEGERTPAEVRPISDHRE
jgi:hypothetical protein